MAICKKFSQNGWSEAVEKLWCLFSIIKLYHMGEHSESIFSQWSTVDDEKLYMRKRFTEVKINLNITISMICDQISHCT